MKMGGMATRSFQVGVTDTTSFTIRITLSGLYQDNRKPMIRIGTSSMDSGAKVSAILYPSEALGFIHFNHIPRKQVKIKEG